MAMRIGWLPPVFLVTQAAGLGGPLDRVAATCFQRSGGCHPFLTDSPHPCGSGGCHPFLTDGCNPFLTASVGTGTQLCWPLFHVERISMAAGSGGCHPFSTITGFSQRAFNYAGHCSTWNGFRSRCRPGLPDADGSAITMFHVERRRPDRIINGRWPDSSGALLNQCHQRHGRICLSGVQSQIYC